MNTLTGAVPSGIVRSCVEDLGVDLPPARAAPAPSAPGTPCTPSPSRRACTAHCSNNLEQHRPVSRRKYGVRETAALCQRIAARAPHLAHQLAEDGRPEGVLHDGGFGRCAPVVRARSRSNCLTWTRQD